MEVIDLPGGWDQALPVHERTILSGAPGLVPHPENVPPSEVVVPTSATRTDDAPGSDNAHLEPPASTTATCTEVHAPAPGGAVGELAGTRFP